MTRNGKTTRSPRPEGTSAAARQAFARLDTILAKNTLSDVEKIDRARRALFGSLPEDAPGARTHGKRVPSVRPRRVRSTL